MVSTLVDTTGPVPLEPGFTVSHQKLELDLDFATQSLRGKTEITILPTTSQLKTVRLNCRQSTLTRLNVNGRGTSIKYHEPFAKARIHKSASVQQYHMLRQKIADQLKDHPEGELHVTLPKSALVEDQSPVGPETSNFALLKNAAGRKRSFEESGLASASGSRPTEESNQKFQPIVIHIEFAIDHFRALSVTKPTTRAILTSTPGICPSRVRHAAFFPAWTISPHGAPGRFQFVALEHWGQPFQPLRIARPSRKRVMARLLEPPNQKRDVPRSRPRRRPSALLESSWDRQRSSSLRSSVQASRSMRSVGSQWLCLIRSH